MKYALEEPAMFTFQRGIHRRSARLQVGGVDVPQPAPDIVPMPPPAPPSPDTPPEIIEPPLPGEQIPVREPIVPGEPDGLPQ
jgi:hypothetical protein